MPTKKYPRLSIGVGSLVVNEKKEILLVKRRKKPKIWSIPGGYMNINETLQETAVREIFEETSIKIKVKGIVAMRQRITLDEGNNFWILTLAEYVSGSPTPDNNEILEARFLSAKEALQKNITPVTEKIINIMNTGSLKLHKSQKTLNKNNYIFFV